MLRSEDTSQSGVTYFNNKYKNKIGYVPEVAKVYESLTAREYLTFIGQVYGLSYEKSDKKARRLMEILKIEHAYESRLSSFSKGMKQKVVIISSMLHNPDILFLDEPLNNLDMKHSVEIMKTLRKLCDELNKTVVIVIHDINFASCYSDYIVALKDGKLVKNGLAEETIKKEELENIYEIDFHIENINDRNICVYF